MFSLLEVALAGLAGAALAAALLAFALLRRFLRAAQREQLVSSVFDATSEGILIVDCDMRIIEANRAFLAMSGYARRELLGQHPRIMQSGRQDASFYSAMWQALAATGQWQGTVWDKRRDGSLFAARLALSVVRDAQGAVQHYLGLFTDITQECRRQEEIAQLAFMDPLTRLPNRRLLQDRLQQALAFAARGGKLVAVCVMDLDGFKAVNDSQGHAAGDQVLVEVGRRLLQVVRANDTVARMGGDEFVLVLADLNEMAEAEDVIGRTLEAVRLPITLEGGASARVSASIGLALFPNDAQLASELLRRADAAMYAAKRRGRDCCERAAAPD